MKKYFEVEASYDDIKRFAHNMNIDADSWDFCFNKGRFLITDNYKELKSSLKYFGKVNLVK